MQENKYINFGRYKIQTLLTKEMENKLHNKVKEYTSIVNLGDGEIAFYIEPYNVPKILDFEIEQITNIKDYINLSSKDMAQLDDMNLKACLHFLEKLMIGYLYRIQKHAVDMIGMVK